MRITRTGLATLAVGVGLAGAAQAAQWVDFPGAFPDFPCQDGWMACIVDGASVSPELVDGPADLRLTWFDLQPTRSFDPFGGLSAYVGVLEENDVPPAVEQDATEAQRAADAAQAEDAARREAEERDAARQVAADEVARQRDAQVRATERADQLVREAQSASAADQQRLAAAAQVERDAAAVAQAAQREAEAERRRQEEAQAAAEAQANAAREAEAERVAKAAHDAEAARVAAANVQAGPVDCTDLTGLELNASLGKLNDGTIACLESRLSAAPRLTEKKKISLVLMANAWFKGDKKSWESLVKRHFDEIGQSDPDLCYKYALYLSTQGPGRATGVIRWANVALENRTAWTGDTFTSRVYSLYKLRAVASKGLWAVAEERHAADASEETRNRVDKHRNMTKVNAREWYEYAKSAGKDPASALSICMSAAGTKDYCEG